MTDSEYLNKPFSSLVNSILVVLQNNEWPAKHRFFLWFSRKYSNYLIRHRINNRAFVVPVDEWCFWLEKGPNNYYLDEFVPFFQKINNINQPVSFFDLGADIGTVSALACKYCNNIQQVFAFEPNKQSFRLLEDNLKDICNLSLCQNLAISNFDGTASFTASQEKNIDHEGCIDISQAGDTQVVMLDSWLQSSTHKIYENIAIKIDVEGQEAQAISGAADIIAKATKAIILLEIHPDVLKSTNTTPEMLFEALEAVRPVKWLVPIMGNCEINRNEKFFNQFSVKQYDIIAILD